MRRGSIAAVAMTILAAAAGVAGCEAAVAAPEPAPEENVAQKSEAMMRAHPSRDDDDNLVGTWLVQSRNIVDSTGAQILPDLDELTVLHGDGTAVSFLFDQNFGSVGAFPAFPQFTNGVGGAGTWRVSGHDNRTVRLDFFRWIWLPKDSLTGSTTPNVVNTQIPVGYVRGIFEGERHGHEIKGHIRLQTIGTDAPGTGLPSICTLLLHKSAPCLLRPTSGVLTADATLTKFVPSDGPDLPRYDVGPFPH